MTVLHYGPLWDGIRMIGRVVREHKYRAALALALFIGVYWTARILVDAFYFSHHDWPEGRFFVLGHVLLTSLFVALAASYFGLLFWRLWFRG